MHARKKIHGYAIQKLVACFKEASETYVSLGKAANAFLDSGDADLALETLKKRTLFVAHFFDLDILALIIHLDEEVARILCEEMSVHSNRALHALKMDDVDAYFHLMSTKTAFGTNRLEILSRQLEMFVPAA
jgi:hypothetical protein